MLLTIELNAELAEELERVKQESQCYSLAQCATEFVECGLAERRLPQVIAGTHGPRVTFSEIGTEENLWRP